MRDVERKRGLRTRAILPWPVRLLLLAVLAAGFNVWLHTQAPGALAHSRSHAIVADITGSYTGIKGDMYTGGPTPIAADGQSWSSEVLWAINYSYCTGSLLGGSWIETGWRQYGGQSPRMYYGYLVPSSCTWKRVQYQSIAPHSYHSQELRNLGSVWRAYHDGAAKPTVTTGWQTAHWIEAGGEVYGDVPTGMQGGVSNLKYRIGTTYYSFDYAHGYACEPIGNPAYNLIWNTTPYNIFDWGYDLWGGGCPDD